MIVTVITTREDPFVFKSIQEEIVREIILPSGDGRIPGRKHNELNALVFGRKYDKYDETFCFLRSVTSLYPRQHR
jgi:hypothetical protein